MITAQTQKKQGRMFSPRAWMILGTMFFMSGCAGLPLRPNGLQVVISPEQVHPGEVVSLKVLAPAGTQAVRARMDLLGSPVVPLRTRDGGRTWVFTTQIPVDAVWQPGHYKVLAYGKAPDGAELTGEAWVTAP